MIKLLMPLIIGLLMGTGLGTGLFIMRGGGEEVAHSEEIEGDTLAHAADSAEAHDPDSTGAPAMDPDTQLAEDQGNTTDSTGAGTAGVDGGTPTDPSLADAGTENTPDPGTDPAQATPTQTAASGQTTTGAPAGGSPQAIEPIPGANLANNVDAAKRLAKIFSTMQARDAAKVLSLMDPSEMELVLRQLDNRSAAKILAGLDAELAAELSQALMRPGGNP